ncbi:YceI family protein [Leptothrix sp. BB-4]
MTSSASLTSLTAVAALGAALLIATPAEAAPVVDAAKSEVTFTIKQMGVPVDGRFKKFDAQMAFDPKKPETGKVGFSIDLGSATMGSAEADVELPKATWFNTAKFPQATFQSSAIKGLGGGKFEVTGKLSIKGASKDVVVPVTLTAAGPAAVATGSFAIKRLDYKVGDGDWSDTSMVANDVTVKFKLQISGLGPL